MQRTPESCAVKSCLINKIVRGGGFRRNFKRGGRNEPFIYIREVRAVGPLRRRWHVRGIFRPRIVQASLISMSKPRPILFAPGQNPAYLQLILYFTFPKAKDLRIAQSKLIAPPRPLLGTDDTTAFFFFRCTCSSWQLMTGLWAQPCWSVRLPLSSGLFTGAWDLGVGRALTKRSRVSIVRARFRSGVKTINSVT